jgi:hypothetical protein
MNPKNHNFHSYVTCSPARASRYEPGKEHGSYEKVRLNASTTINWDPGKGAITASHLSRNKNIHSVKKTFPEAYDQALLMYEKLSFHHRHFNSKLPDPLDMVIKCFAMGPAFAEQYSDERKMGRFKWLGMEFVQPDPSLKSLHMGSYYDSYEVSSFIFWTEKSQDYSYMRMGVPDSDEDYLLLVKQFASNYSDLLLTDDMMNEDIPPSLLNRPVASSGFDANDPTAFTKPEWSLEYDNPSIDGEVPILIAKRSEAPKKPGETRDIGILDPRSMRRHRRFMWNLQRAVSRLETSPHGKDSDYLDKILNFVSTDSEWYYMRDYTKSGMTVPHAVISAFFEGFYQRRPELADMASHWYSGSRIYFDQLGKGEYFHPDTGCPLGLWVEGYTLLQYIINEINLMTISDRHGFKFSATNDDMVIGHWREELIDEYIEIDQTTNSSLGMMYKDTKSGKAPNFVYCEEYVIDGKKTQKDSLYCQGVLSAIMAVNVVQAKDHVYSVLLSCPDITESVMQAVRVVQSCFSYEFTPNEIDWPYIFGGWLPQYKSGIDYSIEWFDGDMIAAAAYWAAREDIHVPKMYDDFSHMTMGRALEVSLLDIPKGYNPNFVDLVTLFGNKETLQRHYLRASISPKAVAREYAGLAKKRIRTFEAFVQGRKEIPPVLDNWLVRHPNSYIPLYLPGVQFGEVEKVSKYSSGLPHNQYLPKLLFMQKKGIIAVRGNMGLRPTHIHFMSMGFSSSIDGETFYVPPQGLSEWVLRTLPRGLHKLYEEHHVTISLLNDDDRTVKCSALWVNGNAVNLVDSKRYTDWLREKGADVNDQSLMWLYDTIMEMRKANKPASFLDETYDSIYYKEDPEFRARMQELVSGMFGDLSRHIQILKTPEDIPSDRVLTIPEALATATGEGNSASSESDDSTHGGLASSGSEGGLGDVWDELEGFA